MPGFLHLKGVARCLWATLHDRSSAFPLELFLFFMITLWLALANSCRINLTLPVAAAPRHASPHCRGHVTQDAPRPGNPFFAVHAYLPVLESFGSDVSPSLARAACRVAWG